MPTADAACARHFDSCHFRLMPRQSFRYAFICLPAILLLVAILRLCLRHAFAMLPPLR